MNTTLADVPVASSGVPIVGAVGFLPPESTCLLLETAIIYEAERSPVATHVSDALFRSVTPDH